MSTPHDPWWPGPTASDEDTVKRPTDGTYTRPTWPAAEGSTADPDATQVRTPRVGYGQPGHGQPDHARPDYGRPDAGPSGYGRPDHGPGRGQAGPYRSVDVQPGYVEPGPQPGDPRSRYGPPVPRAPGYDRRPSPPGYGQDYGPQHPGASAYGQPGYPPAGGYHPRAPAAAGRPSAARRSLIIGLCALLVLGLATVGFAVLRPSSSPTFTFAGKKISNAGAVLTAAQATTATLVASRHGASDSDTRCYFALAKKPANGASKSDVDANTYCGPVLFVDGDRSKPYLTYALTRSGTKGDAVTLAAATTPTSAQPQSAPADRTLTRPDKVAAKTSTLAVPSPPPAAQGFFSTTADITGQTLDAAPTDAVIGSRNGGVEITRLGAIARYGRGDDARSAPSGQKLIAFTTAPGPDEDGDDVFPFGTVTVVADGNTHTLPKRATTAVVAVSTSATSADLVVDDAGVTQKISLLTGRPAVGNIVVGRRRHRGGPAAGSKTITFTISDAGDAVTRTARASLLGSDLRYWVRVGDNRHAGSTGSALLYVDLEYTYTQPLKPPFTRAGSNGPYGFTPQLLALHLPNGQVVAAHNYATDPKKLFLLFSVPPSFTSGRIVLSGRQPANENGVVLGLQGTSYFDVRIPAG